MLKEVYLFFLTYNLVDYNHPETDNGLFMLQCNILILVAAHQTYMLIVMDNVILILHIITACGASGLIRCCQQ